MNGFCNKLLVSLVFMTFLAACQPKPETGKSKIVDRITQDSIQYHPVRIDQHGNILPWFSKDPGASYDTILSLVWNFWKNMPIDSNGIKYYLNHQVWKPEHDMRGLGGDQISMALSSWALYYAYTGDRSLVDDMIYQADTYLEHGLSPGHASWPDLPFPYNTVIHSGIYDGDMRDGKGILQPDKAGSFGHELVTLYKITGNDKYLAAARRIADCLSAHTVPGDSLCSPLPFRVNAYTGETGNLLSNHFTGEVTSPAGYTTNWSSTLMLFEELSELGSPHSDEYQVAFQIILEWMKEHPLRSNRWGPFFEDIPGWSDTQINAITFAMFILQHRDLFPDWKEDVKGIIEWTHRELGNHEYERYHVEVMNEQTVYRVPGNSHTSRQSSVELMYAALTGDTSCVTNAIRALNWATYTVDHDGKNRYIRDDIWLTDGYGDYVRHFLRAMDACPQLAPDNEDHLLSSTSVVRQISYSANLIAVETFTPATALRFKLNSRPVKVMAGGIEVPESTLSGTARWNWAPMEKGGLLTIADIGTEGPLRISW
jgi:hypothetical protein